MRIINFVDRIHFARCLFSISNWQLLKPSIRYDPESVLSLK
jgi:hypothetical protein